MSKEHLTPKFVYRRCEPVVRAAEECPLTERERQCLELVAAGYVTKQAAFIIGCKDRTVNFHIQNALRKMNVPNRYIAAHTALAKGWITLQHPR